MKKLDDGQKHVMRLLVKDMNADGWTTISKPVGDFLLKTFPSELLEVKSSDDKYLGRLTAKGEEVYAAMEYL